MLEPERILKLETGRMPPQAIDAEMSVLGSILFDFKSALPKAIEILAESDFYKPAHQVIFSAMKYLYDKGDPVDLLTVIERLKKSGQLEKAGMENYIGELSMKMMDSQSTEYMARVVFEKSLARQIITVGSEMVSRSYSGTEDILKLLEESEGRIFDLSEFRVKQNAVSVSQSIQETVSALEKIHGHSTGVTGVPSGYPVIDSMTGGFHKGDLILIAGRTSQGKTALVLGIVRHAAMAGYKIGFFSLEMSTEQLETRLIAGEARVNAHPLRTGRLKDADWVHVSLGAAAIAKLPMWIDETPHQSITDIRAKSRQLKHQHGVDLVVVDYLQLMSATGGQSREQEVASISRGLKALAKELHIPVIALSQLNRSVDNRTDKRPVLADLRESGSLEHDSDVVMFVHRPETYGEKETEDGQSTQGLAEIIIAKQRSGPTGSPRLTFIKEYAKFENFSSRPVEKEDLPF